MSIAVRVLVIGETEEELAWLLETLKEGNVAAQAERATDEAHCRALLRDEHWHAVLVVFRNGAPPPALRALRERRDGVDPGLVLVADEFEDAAEAAQRLGGTVCLRGAGFGHLGPALARAVREKDLRSERARSFAFEERQRKVLEHVAAGVPLPQLLEEIVLLIEAQGEGMLCSILLLDPMGKVVRHGAAPNLPRALVEGVDGAAIGPREGSCGAAAYLGEPVVVSDIGTHPNWTNYRHLAIPFGLRACWSSPILPAPGGKVLGTFAMYYREAREPREEERVWVARATHLAAVAIQHDRAERRVRETDARYRQIVDTAYEGVWLFDAEARTLFTNERTAKLLGYEPGELLGKRIVDFMDPESRRAVEGSFLERLRTVSEQHESRFRRKDGTYFWALVSGSPVRNEQGETRGALAMITDISELKQTEEALRQSEAEFRVVFENAGIGMALLDEHGRIVRSNPALQNFLGYAEHQLRGLEFADLAPPVDDRAELAFHRELMTRQREAFRAERRFLNQSGELVWGRLTASLVQPSDRMPLSVIVMVEDVTVRRQLEESVRASERLRTLMYSAVSDVLFYLEARSDGSYHFLSVNPAFLRATGLQEADVIGKSVAAVIPEPSLSLVLEKYGRAIDERRTISWDEVTPYPAGKKYGEVSITPIFDRSGVCTNLVGTVHDVTERRLAELRVAAQAALLDKARDAILVTNPDGVIEYWNHGAERLYGWTREDAVGKNVGALLYRNRDAVAAAQQAALERGQWSGELGQYDSAGKRLIVESSWTLIQEEASEPRKLLIISSDITQKKQLESELFHAQRLESLGVLAGGVAHDFNNLLGAIVGNVSLARLSPIEAPDALEEISAAASRGAHLVRRLLTFSRRQETSRQPTELPALVTEALSLLRGAIPRTIRIHTHVDAEVPTILADPTQIHQILINLGTNAAHAIGERDGNVRVKVERVELAHDLSVRSGVLPAGTYARLEVSDDGPGMDERTLEKIFDPFFTTKTAESGTGLGLSVVHGILMNHEGGIVVTSSPGQGATFSLYFPALVRPPSSTPTE